MPFKSYPYQECTESDVSEEEIDQSETEKLLEEPSDCYYFVYLTFFIIGITSYFSGCFFTVANKYWMYKFRDSKNETLKLNPLQVSYTAYATLASCVPLPICFIINVFINEKISCQKRIIGSLIVMLILSVITLIFVKVDTNLWQNGFLVLTLFTIVILNAASGILLSTVGGINNNFSAKYITSFSLGQGVGMVLSALAEIVSVAIASSATLDGLIYSVIGCFILFIALAAYLILPKNLYYKHFMVKSNENGITKFENDLVGHLKISYKLICKKIWHHVFCACLGSIVSLSVQPGVTVLIKSYGNGIWSDRYFIPVMTFLVPNVGVCFGSILSMLFDWVKMIIRYSTSFPLLFQKALILIQPKNKYVLILLNVIQIGSIPMFLYCNLQPRRNLPVIFNSDAYFIVFQAIAGFVNGYLLNIAMLNIPRVLDDHEKYLSGLISSIFISLAVSVGSLLSTVLVKII